MLLGKFAERHVMEMGAEALDEYEVILSQETIDIFNLVTGKDEPSQVSRPSRVVYIFVYCPGYMFNQIKLYFVNPPPSRNWIQKP